MESPSPAPSRRTYLQRPFDERLLVAENLVAAVRANADLRDALATVGVTPAMIDGLDDALAPVRDAVGAQTRAAADARAASDAQRAALTAAESAHEAVALRARAALRSDLPMRRALGFDRKAPRQAARLAQMRQTYDAAPAHIDRLASYGVTEALLTAGRTALDAAEAAVLDADRKAALAQVATDARDRAMHPVDQTVRDVQERAKAALTGRPQLLELVGLRPR